MSQLCQYHSLSSPAETLTGDTGGAVSPTVGNINIFGDGTAITVDGNPATSTLTINPMPALTTQYPTDTLLVIPVDSVLEVLGGTNIGTVGLNGNPAIPTSSSITINLDDNVSIAGTFDAVGDITTSTGDIVSTLGAGSFATSVTVGNDLHVLAGGADIVGTVEFSDLTAGTMRTNAAGVISSLADGTDGMVLISSTAGTPIWAVLTAGANIGIAEAANSITISATGVVTSVTAGTNINLTGTATDPIINLDDSISLAGTVTAATGMTITNNDLNISSGKILLPTTSSTDGQIQINGTRVFHTYGTNNLFIGKNAGNFTLTTAIKNVGVGEDVLGSLTTGDQNVAIGHNVMNAVTTGVNNMGCGADTLDVLIDGDQNTAYGASSLGGLTTGDYNCAVGGSVLYRLITGSYNTAIGYVAGWDVTSSESSNIFIANKGVAADNNKIRIGTQGSGVGQQNACYVAGIYGVTPAGTKNIALIDSNHQLGSVATLTVANGGTGAATFTDHGILIGSAAAAVTVLAEASNGQIPIGSVGADPVLATITEGTNIDVTNGAGSITIETTKVEINAQTGTSYTLVLGDRGKTITLTNAAAIALTVPPNASVAFPIGTVISLYQGGAGQVTVTPGAAVTIRSLDSNLKISGQYGMVALTKLLSDTWVCAGSLSA